MQNELLDEELTVGSRTYDSKTITKINDLKIQMTEDLNNISMGRAAFFCLALLNVIVIFFGWITGEDFSSGQQAAVVFESVIVSLIYLVLALLVPRKPLLCLILGLSIYLLYMLLNALISTETLFSGVFIKVAVIAATVKAIMGALSLGKTTAKLREFGISQREIKQAILKLKQIPRTKRPGE